MASARHGVKSLLACVEWLIVRLGRGRDLRRRWPSWSPDSLLERDGLDLPRALCFGTGHGDGRQRRADAFHAAITAVSGW